MGDTRHHYLLNGDIHGRSIGQLDLSRIGCAVCRCYWRWALLDDDVARFDISLSICRGCANGKIIPADTSVTIG